MTAPFSPAPPPPGHQSLAADWDPLLGAVIARLRLIAGDPALACGGTCLQDAAACLQAGVLECAAALDQIHSMIKDEFMLFMQGQQLSHPDRAG